MRGRLVLCSLLISSAAVVFNPQQPSLVAWAWWAAGLIGLALLCAAARFLTTPPRQSLCVTAAWGLCVASVALLATAQRVGLRLDDALAPHNVDRVSRVTVRVTALAQIAPNGRRFQAEVLAAEPAGVPRHIMVAWFAPGRHSVYQPEVSWPFAEIVPGQVWRMALNLRPPQGERNPHAFDVEGYLFAQGVRAIGRVRGTPVLLRDEPWADLSIVAQRLRHVVRAAMQPTVAQARYGAVLVALAIGDQAGVDAADWQVFNRSGITHLVSISGSHITMIAALGGFSVFGLWKRGRWRGRWWAERVPAQLAGAWAALLVAWLYCLLAGWGVPAQRTFWMLAVLAFTYTLRLPLAASTLLLFVACVVVTLDPWALMSSGFWLSFGAVAVLMASKFWEDQVWHYEPAAPQRSRLQRLGQKLWLATRLQLAITAALLPFLARLFHEISLVSPLANAYAIPLIGLVVTPLALLLAFLACVPGLDSLAQGVAWLGHSVLWGMMQPTQWLTDLPFASVPVPVVPWALTLLAVLGLAVALWPTDRALRHWAWLLLLPALLWRPDRPALGDWRLTVLDTGQSGAAVLQTHSHALLFDTGLRASPNAESGSRTIVPFLRSQGIRTLDTLIVSHADLDHAGGASGVLHAIPVQQTYSSFDLPAWLQREAQRLGAPQHLPPMPQQALSCRDGTQWEVDGVRFTFLWPPATTQNADTAQSTNAHSCVLLVRGAQHAILFTGDIGAAQEHALVASGLSNVDVVLAPHHGSRFSSSEALIKATDPAHVIAQAGLWNAFGHPHPLTSQRWKRAGAWFWRTDLDGAIQVQSKRGELEIHATRERWPRYWQLPCHVRQACDQESAE